MKVFLVRHSTVLLFIFTFFTGTGAMAQCGDLAATVQAIESRCTSTGTIVVTATGGVLPVRYQYRISAGPVTTAYTSSNTFSGLQPGTYTIVVRDVTANCTITKPGNVITGNYVAPTIFYNSTALTCMNGSNGTIFVTSQAGGRSPFSYKIIAPSPSGVGTVSANGTFNNLVPGVYTIRMTDSCGGIQTRTQRVQGYSWSILPTSNATKNSCQDLTVNVFLNNSNGVHSPDPVYNGYQYGVSKFAGDTTWFSTASFNINIGAYRKVSVVVKDACGLVIQSFPWTDTAPYVDANVAVSNFDCTSFTATVPFHTFMNPLFTTYCLYDETNTTIVSPCQSSDVFNNIPYGIYTLRINESCYDTTILRTVAGAKPLPSADNAVSISNATCNSFTATVTGQLNINGAVYQLFDGISNTQIGANQSSPSFEPLAYGDYCIHVVNDPACYDTTIVICFTPSKPAPSVNDIVSVRGRACSTFTATIITRINLTNPVYRLFDAANNIQIRPDQGTPSFALVPYGSYCIRVINDPACYDTTIVRCFTVDKPVPSVDADPAIRIESCATFTATITGRVNLNNAIYSLYDASNSTQIGTDQVSPEFTGLPYGSYCVRISNSVDCYDTTIVRCFTANKPLPSLEPNVAISNQSCSTFTATITGQVNLSNELYSLFDGANNLQIGADQSSPVFNGLAFGSYCIRVKNGPACYDSTIVTCFAVSPPVPAASAAVITGNLTCAGFTASVDVSGQSNMNNPVYSLFDGTNNTQIGADQSSPDFNGLPYGSYCIRTKNDPACYDTTIVTCFFQGKLIPAAAAIVTLSNQSCTGFDASITGQVNISNAVYRIFDVITSTQVRPDQNNGNFTGLAYGSYCIHIVNDIACYDTVITRCFSLNKPQPSGDAAVTISNQTCSGFTATVTGQTNVSNPVYRLFDAVSNVQVGADQTSASFVAVPYGDYCIRIVNDPVCYDTTMIRCFTVTASIAGVELTTLSANANCAQIGTTDVQVSVINGSQPYLYKIYAPSGVLLQTNITAATSYTFTQMPGLPLGVQYKVTVDDDCSAKDSSTVTPVVYYFDKTITKSANCPTGTNPYGTGDVTIQVNENLGGWYSTWISKKDGAATFIAPTSYANFGQTSNFEDLDPGTYVFESYVSNSGICSFSFYDTVVVPEYIYPNLSNSKGYICDNGLQSISSSTIGGALPLEYQIFESLPVSPDINTSYQASPIFEINNGTTYDLVRLRVLDACGNASINDVGFVPVATPIIQTTNDCFFAGTSLSVEALDNATYTWYKRTYAPVDSILLGTGNTYTIPFLTVADTGTYICTSSLNNGCINKVSYTKVNGNCKASVGNWVWIDRLNGPTANGRQDPGEKGAPGVLVSLLNASGAEVANIITDSSGYYSFTDIEPGNYSIYVHLPSGFLFSPQTNTNDSKDAGAENGSDVNSNTGVTYMINLVAGESDMDVDAGIVQQTILPIGLRGFTASPEGNNIQLRWTVADENNVARYEVEYSATSSGFNYTIGIVTASGRGVYNLLHTAPVKGINYYRLKVVDRDGRVSYSEIRKVNFGKGGSIAVYPNPARDIANVMCTAGMLNKPATMELFSAGGQSMLLKKIPACSQIEVLDLSLIPPGKYIIRIVTDTEVVNTSVQVLK